MKIQGVGAQFRDERLRQNLSLGDIAARTRIQAKFLEAIEKDDFGQFPGIVFARNFVRQYAIALSLDPEPLLALMPRLSHEAVRLPDPPARARAQRTRLSSAWSSVGWSLAAVAALAGAWGYHNRADIAHTLQTGNWIPAWTKSAWQTATGSQQRDSAVAVADPRPQMIAEAAPQPEPVVPDGTPAGTPAEAPAATTSAETPAGTPSAPAAAPVAGTHVATGAVRVVVMAQEPSWISVTADGRTAFVGLLKASQTREISAADHVKILTGNAGGLVISLNGKTIDPIGPRGQIRTVRLTADGSELLTKAPVSTGDSTAGSASENVPAGPL